MAESGDYVPVSFQGQIASRIAKAQQTPAGLGRLQIVQRLFLPNIEVSAQRLRKTAVIRNIFKKSQNRACQVAFEA